MRAHGRDPWTRLPAPLRYAIVLFVLLALWQGYVTFSHVSQLLVGSPIDVAKQMWTDVLDGKIPAGRYPIHWRTGRRSPLGGRNG